MKYSTILCDPPWMQSGGGVCKRGADKHYPLMNEQEILTTMQAYLDEKVADDAHLYMWVANNHLPEALRIIENLGFRYITNIVWTKNRQGLGRYFRGKHELCFFAIKGKGMSCKTEANDITSHLGNGVLPITRHSAKPPEMYELIEKRSKGPYLEMFARNTREGWVSWGNEV